ncbi:MAG: glycosyltransferase [Candidatus Aenigmarchaeota archaeon]|nr:glycosyltransferase [Candidatus Aenigmarchaeota archaeon]
MGMKLSIIMPVYNGSSFIEKNVLKVKDVLDTINIDYEIIVVNDGSTDNTKEELMKINKGNIKTLSYEKNQGKGHAIKHGFKSSEGELVGFLDSDLDLNPGQIKNFVKFMESTGADIVIGSKRHPLSNVSYPMKRRVLSAGYQFINKILFNLNVRDTQVGLKLFKHDALEDILPRIMVKQYAFDLEVLVNANMLGYKIIEAPIDLDFKFNGSFVKMGAIWNIILDTCSIFYRKNILHSYSKKRCSE